MKILFKQTEAMELLKFVNETNVKSLDFMKSINFEFYGLADDNMAVVDMEQLIKEINTACRGYMEIKKIERKNELMDILERTAREMEEEVRPVKEEKETTAEEEVDKLDALFDYYEHSDEEKYSILSHSGEEVEAESNPYMYELTINSEYIKDSMSVYRAVLREGFKLALDAYRSYKFVIEAAISKFISKYTNL